ncbi:MAG: PIG-L family deacetylase [Parcubacteria group bacterium]|nr:PIG-L family deacetylase [Parcubacteria group bacterium]
MKEINNNFERIFPKENVIVMLHAHADDESFLSAGTINEFIVRNYNVLLIYLATGLIEEEKRTTIRRKELTEALKVLGVKNVEFLEYCEPKYTVNGKPLYLQSIKEISNDIRTIIEKRGIKHYTLFSYDKNGGYGNKDHLVVHKAGRLLFENSSPVSLLFEVTIPRDVYLRWIGKNKNNVPELYLPKLNYWSTEFGLKNEEIDYFYLLNSVQIKLKKKALSKHVSQIKNKEFPLSLTNADFIELFGREYFAYVDRSIL